MKKKLKLDDLKVKSFVTSELNANQIKGGAQELPDTFYSCLAYVTCDVVGCVNTKYGDRCYTGGANTTTLQA
ncbi:MAG TPA: pinensin family lanthipeptide [Luteibaculaceae bacterium]|nr:pinensin family lanthipeptide [Luteibaculaceae bacterium]